MTQVYLILLALHILLSIVCAIDDYAGKLDIQRAMLRFVVSFTIPVFGFTFIWLSDYYTEHITGEQAYDVNLLKENNEELELLKPIDSMDEVNKVPMVEALSMGDYSYRRKVVIDTLKEDSAEYLDVLRDALINEDRETSHYASAIIMDIQAKLQDGLFKKEALFNDNQEDLELAYDYEAELFKTITSGIYDKRNLNKFYVKYKVISDKILSFEEDIKEDCYHNRIFIDFETDDIVHAEYMCNLYKRKYPGSEEMVVDNIKLCIRMENREKLDNFMEELKKLPVLLTSYSLSYVRFFERKKG